MKIIYEADDKKQFNTHIECLNYEKNNEFVNHIKKFCPTTYSHDYCEELITHVNVEQYIFEHFDAIKDFVKNMVRE